MKTTNYYNTFIEVAEDCPVSTAEIPPVKGDKKTVANLQYEMIAENPYAYLSDDVVFHVYAMKQDIPETEQAEAREIFFSKGQPCLRSSPLAKRYGWGFHFDENGKVAAYAVDSEEYKKLKQDKSLEHTKAMRSSRK